LNNRKLKDYLDKIYQEDLAAAAAEAGLQTIPGVNVLGFGLEVLKTIAAKKAAELSVGIQGSGPSVFDSLKTSDKKSGTSTERKKVEKKNKSELTPLEKKIKLDNNYSIINNNLTYIRYIIIAYLYDTSGNVINRDVSNDIFDDLNNGNFKTDIDGQYTNTQKAIRGIKINGQEAKTDNFYEMLNEIFNNRNTIEDIVEKVLRIETKITFPSVNNIFEKYYDLIKVNYKITKG
jgi:heat shock protein HspQ